VTEERRVVYFVTASLVIPRPRDHPPGRRWTHADLEALGVADGGNVTPESLAKCPLTDDELGLRRTIPAE
jgi:hypothetical protein